MFENIRFLYRYYGGICALFSSSYFWTSLIFSILIGILFDYGSWYKIAQNTLPSLAGFSIAAFAVIFAALNSDQISALLISKDDTDKPPLLVVASSLCHAIVVQVFTIFLSGIVLSTENGAVVNFCNENITNIDCNRSVDNLEYVLHLFGHFLLFYSWMLVLAVALSIFRILVSISRVR